MTVSTDAGFKLPPALICKYSLPMQMSGGSTFSKSTPHQDAIQALVSLGIQKVVAEKAIDKAIQSEGADVSLEILIKQALKNC